MGKVIDARDRFRKRANSYALVNKIGKPLIEGPGFLAEMIADLGKLYDTVLPQAYQHCKTHDQHHEELFEELFGYSPPT